MSQWELKEPQCSHKIEWCFAFILFIWKKIKIKSSTLVLHLCEQKNRRLHLPRKCIACIQRLMQKTTFSYKQAFQYKADHKSSMSVGPFFTAPTLMSSEQSFRVLEIIGLLFGQPRGQQKRPFYVSQAHSHAEVPVDVEQSESRSPGCAAEVRTPCLMNVCMCTHSQRGCLYIYVC